MTISVTSAPAEEPITLTEAKAHLRVDGTTEDTLITSLITAARRRCEAFTRRKFVTQTVVLRRSRLGPAIMLPVAPVQSITSIVYLDTANASQTLAADQYRLDESVLPPRIVPSHLASWPATLSEPDCVDVTLVVGYGDASAVPEDIKTAIKMVIASMERDREGQHGLPEMARDLLMPFVVWV